MPYSVYDAGVGNAEQILNALEAILKEGQAAPNSASFPEARIHPDMLPLSFQVHIATVFAMQVVHRLSGTEPENWDNDLKTFDDFYARIEKTRKILATADRAKIEARQDETITVPMGPYKLESTSGGYLNGFWLLNVHFHLTTAYDILRKEGVPLGKKILLTPFLNANVKLHAAE